MRGARAYAFAACVIQGTSSRLRASAARA